MKLEELDKDIKRKVLHAGSNIAMYGSQNRQATDGKKRKT